MVTVLLTCFEELGRGSRSLRRWFVFRPLQVHAERRLRDLHQSDQFGQYIGAS